MWKNFYTKKNDLNIIIPLLEKWKSIVFSHEETKVKEYFATKVVVGFDNMMIFHQKKGLHTNLSEALALATQDMKQASMVFPPIYFHLIQEDVGYSLITKGVTTEHLLIETKSIFKEVTQDFNEVVNQEALQFNAWSTLSFHLDLVDFSQNWINYTPDTDMRSVLQVESILFHMQFKKKEASLLEKINFYRDIKSHPQYQELLTKVLKVMPKIESSLEQEWRTNLMQTGLDLNQSHKNML